jgi:hypothetical protein
MALLNPPDVLPEAMRFLLRALLAAPDRRLTEAVLLALVAPEGMAEVLKTAGGDETAEEKEDAKAGGRTIAKKSLDALGLVGLVEFDGTGPSRTVTPAPAVIKAFPSFDRLVAPDFARFLRRHLLEAAWADADIGHGTGSADLAQGLALLHLVPEPLRPFGGFDSSDRMFQHTQRDLLGPSKRRWPVPNKEQYLPFIRWSVYLGFATAVPGGRTVGLVPDASFAIAELMEKIVPGRRAVGEVIAELGGLVPILDGGRLHAQMREEITDGPPAGSVSPGLALTLQRLHHGGVITLERRSDAPTLEFPIGDPPLLVSHVGPGERGD